MGFSHFSNNLFYVAAAARRNARTHTNTGEREKDGASSQKHKSLFAFGYLAKMPNLVSTTSVTSIVQW